MSENKNGQGAQWSKGAVTAATAAAAAAAAAQKQQQQQLQQQQHLQHTPVYNATALSLTSPPAGTASALYGGTGHLGTHQTSSDVTSYAAARFQAPPIDHRSASSSSSHIVPPTPAPSTSTTNVPVPSGFIPPPFPPAAAAATSVLTPNPYAVASLTAPGSTHASANHPHSHAHSHPPPNQQYSGSHPMASSHHAHFGMEQFQHLNVQQQYELSKLMAASFSATQQAVGVSSGPTNLSSNTTSLTTSSLSATTASSTNVAAGGTSTSQASAASRHPPQSSGESSTSGSINTQMADQVISAISTGTTATKLATTPIHGRLMGLGVHAPDEEKLRRIQQVVESGIGCVFKHNKNYYVYI